MELMLNPKNLEQLNKKKQEQKRRVSTKECQ